MAYHLSWRQTELRVILPERALVTSAKQAYCATLCKSVQEIFPMGMETVWVTFSALPFLGENTGEIGRFSQNRS